MDREQEEMQFMGLLGIFVESFKIIQSWRRIFTQISLTLVLPLSLVFLLSIDVSEALISKINSNEQVLDRSAGTPRYKNLSDAISTEWAFFRLFKAAYFTFFLVLSLLSTAAVVYTVACIYTARDVTFRNVLRVVPRVWKRLVVTFLCTFFAFTLYNAFFAALVFAAMTMDGKGGDGSSAGSVALIALAVLYVVGFTYMAVVWQLASVVSVLEEDYGVRAMVKSRGLIKGNFVVSITIFLILNLCFWFVQAMFETLVVQGSPGRIPARAGYAVLFLTVTSGLFLFGLTVQTVIYLVCKSYHHENIHKSALWDHLEAYLGDYVSMESKVVHLEQCLV
ncbi:hypothetical protein SAY86_019658 [Trapa natans]|uniref:Uncharacterized protein n=1 Tax=Trapa natans TaxID=22666 RepID=A0AAN7LPA7_TRANT|nr:hypothetical protein SAY86_019658 [Trapa natans]